MKFWLQMKLLKYRADDLNALENILQQMGGFASMKKQNNFLQLFYSNGNANAAAINQYCFQNNIALNHLQLKKKSLRN